MRVFKTSRVRVTVKVRVRFGSRVSVSDRVSVTVIETSCVARYGDKYYAHGAGKSSNKSIKQLYRK